jgi:hypothetical protein
MSHIAKQRNYLLEALSSYFVNDYFTHVYNAAKSDRKGSLTEAYQEKVTNYIRGIKGVQKIYCRLCSDIHRYITKSARFSSLMYGEFVDRLVNIFTPDDYYEVLTRNQKDEIFSSIINDLAATLGAYCLKPPILRKIIDEHEASKHVTQDTLYNEALAILEHKRETLMHSYVKSISQSKDMISVEVANKYRDQVEELKVENNNLRSIVSDLESEIESLEDGFKQKEHAFRKIIEYLKEQLKERSKTKTIVPTQTKQQQTDTQEVAVLTENNLKRHTALAENKPKKVNTILKDESSSSSSAEIVGSKVRRVLTAEPLDEEEYLASNRSVKKPTNTEDEEFLLLFLLYIYLRQKT